MHELEYDAVYIFFICKMELSGVFVFGFNGFGQLLLGNGKRILMVPVELECDISRLKRKLTDCNDQEEERASNRRTREKSPSAMRGETDDSWKGARASPSNTRSFNNFDKESVVMHWNATLFSSSGFLIGCLNGEMGKFIDLSEDLHGIASSSPRKFCLHGDNIYLIDDSGDCYVREISTNSAAGTTKVQLMCSGSTVIPQGRGQQVKVEQENKIEDAKNQVSDFQREESIPTRADGCSRDVDETLPSSKAKEQCGFRNLSAGDSHVLATFGPEHQAGRVTKHDDRAYIFHPFTQPIDVQEIACGKEHALLLTSQGLTYSYGTGSRGQLGHGDIGKEDVPKLIEAIACVSMVTVRAGGWHSACISAIGDLYIWGWNESGQLGLTQEGSSHDVMPDKVSFQMVPAILDLPGGVNVLKVSCGSRHTAAVTFDKRLYTWGWGKYGQLGHGDMRSLDTPKMVEFFLQNRLDVLDLTCGDWITAVYTRSSPAQMPR
ncbi:uncharacterized protein LOC129272866 [Lytechinus pictus]|uniref:uncharacterized protein LOC129272866 n=1 Tax=Lytechinus pictus TaxID=7653 RepID=UPI0030B9D294